MSRDGIGELTTAMTDGSSGVPEGGAGQDDDPFAYLYRPESGEAPAAERTPGVPRTSYARPMEVGRAQYGQYPQQQYPPQGPPPFQQQPYRPQGPGPGGPGAPGNLPHQQPRYAESSRPQPGEDAPRRRGKGPVIGIVAVIAAVAIGGGIALSGGGGRTDDKASGGTPTSTTGSHPGSPSVGPSSASPSASPSASGGPALAPNTSQDASKAQAQNAPSGNSVKGALSSDGSYVTFQSGSSLTWTLNVPSAGKYKLWFHYNNNGGTVTAPATVNGQPFGGGPVSFQNYGGTGGDQSQSWYTSNFWPVLQAGTNTITLSAPSGTILIDQVVLTPFGSSSYPSGAPAAN
ncbi:hypothetical protein ACIGXM_30745 [Kitasatospora sp. NPDC052896]|uniref:hypothetical protein n=1 Tax=Kitasatospora sp. NPDC052896 TaxID=3364061 RepID=UPI0037C5A259